MKPISLSKPHFTIGQQEVRLSASHPVRWQDIPVHRNVAFHDHEFTEICLVKQGRATHLMPSAGVPIRRGSVMIIPPGRVHGFEKGPGFEVINIYYLPEWFLPELPIRSDLKGLLPVFFSSSVFSGKGPSPIFEFAISEKVFGAVLRELSDIGHALSSGGNARWVACCFFKILLLLTEAYGEDASAPPASIPPAVWETFSEIDRVAFAAEKLDLAALAKRLGLTRDHLARLFHRQVGLNPQKFFQRRRIQFVCRLLLETDLTLSEIAYKMGFSDQAHMCHFFKREIQLTPTAYRQKFSPP